MKKGLIVVLMALVATMAAANGFEIVERLGDWDITRSPATLMDPEVYGAINMKSGLTLVVVSGEVRILIEVDGYVGLEGRKHDEPVIMATDAWDEARIMPTAYRANPSRLRWDGQDALLVIEWLFAEGVTEVLVRTWSYNNSRRDWSFSPSALDRAAILRLFEYAGIVDSPVHFPEQNGGEA